MSKKLYPRLNATLHEVLESIPAPDQSRIEKLSKIADWLSTDPSNRDLIFVCTHNSRRSHMAQNWATAAAEFYDIEGIKTYSAGTESTAMHPHTVEALAECGFEINAPDNVASNPYYEIRISGMIPSTIGFSKTLTHESLPKSNFCAVMVCDEAAEACPIVPGASLRVPLSFKDPKESDNTPKRRAVYLRRSKEIGREMMWVMEQVKKDATH
ncbi:MAG TPA: protein-tyrosine-phosphatase [Bacteroidetes bacterium]|nr:protein-tyrosine-phosphatase [Bacteroidota bacterium]